jgi:glycosyltransferase involved in cell wall biosynthesis
MPPSGHANVTSNAQPAFSLVMPCYNEQDVLRNSVSRVLEVFERKQIAFELVLVDNGSRDRTGAIIDQMIQEGLPVVKETVKVNQGYGYGVIRGLQVCRGKLVGMVPADLQVDADEIYKVFQIAATVTTPHLVKVRRRFRMDGFKRKVVSTCFNIIANLLFGGVGSIDINGNPKILPREYIDKMQLQSSDWFIDTEILLKAKRLKLPVLEFNVLGQMREGGESNVRGTTCWEFVRNLLRWRLGWTGHLNIAQAAPAPGQRA